MIPRSASNSSTSRAGQAEVGSAAICGQKPNGAPLPGGIGGSRRRSWSQDLPCHPRVAAKSATTAPPRVISACAAPLSSVMPTITRTRPAARNLGHQAVGLVRAIELPRLTGWPELWACPGPLDLGGAVAYPWQTPFQRYSGPVVAHTLSARGIAPTARAFSRSSLSRCSNVSIPISSAVATPVPTMSGSTARRESTS